MKRSKFDLMAFMVPDFFKGMIKVPDIQRENTAWSLSQRQSLIDSLYNDFDIPKIYFRNKEANPGIWWLIDGQQRLTAIRDFLENKFSLGYNSTLPHSVRGKLFKELESNEQDRISKRILDCVIIECSEEEEEDMFVRLNNGTPLSLSEKRNAVKGEFRDSVKVLSEHSFFVNSKYNFSPKRFAVDVLCAQYSCLVLHKIPAFTSKAIDLLYERYKDYPQRSEVETKVSGILDWLDQIFEQKEKYLKKSTLISYFALLSHLAENYDLSGIYPKDIYHFFNEFENQKEANANLEGGSPLLDRELIEYQVHLNKGAYSVESLNKRHEILLKRFMLRFPDVKLKS